MMTAKTISQMQDEVVAVNQEKGWYDKEISFDEAIAMLHSEVSEALEAWRVWGVQDGTYHVSAEKYMTGPKDFQGGPPKPEGVGSEFADILIRLLDDCSRFGVDIEKRVSGFGGRFGFNDSFVVNLNTLHTMIARASMTWDGDFPETEALYGWKHELTYVLLFLIQLCEHYGIDLEAEYERKMAYNRTRAYRHGGKRI